jgi:hypothetical protein
MVKRIFLAITFVLALVSSGWGELSVSVSRNQISINDSLVVEVVLQGDHDEDPDLSGLEQDFEIVGRSQSSQIQIINGDMTRSIKWSLSLLPRRPGVLTIPSLCAGQDCSQPLTITVVPQSQQPAEDAEVIVEVEAQPADRMVVQGQILYTVRLLHRQPLAQASLSSPEPQGVETLVQKLGEDQRSETFRNGWRYQVIERRYALFPQQSGKLHLPALQFEAVVQNGRNLFDVQARVLRTRSDSIDMRIDPPESTDHPWLPAQAIRVEDDWQQHPPTLTVGEPATRTITVRGAGVTAAQLPDIALTTPDGFKGYPDQPSREDVIAPTGISGVLVQKVALVPTHAGQLTLPPVTLWWWDLTTHVWRQETLPAVDVTVLPAQRQAEVTPPLTAPPTPAAPVPPEALIPPKAAPPAVPSATSFHPWRWSTLICALGWFATLLLWWRQKKELPPSPAVAALPTEKSSDCKKRFMAAIKTHDARTSYAILCEWGDALGQPQCSGLEYWQRIGGESVRLQLQQLSAHLYAPQTSVWQGEELASAVEHCLKQQCSPQGESLPDFYPRG